MSSVRVLVGTKKAPSSSPPTANARSGRSAGRSLAAGRSITSRVRRSIRIEFMLRNPADGLGRSFSASNDGGKTWEQPGTKAGEPTTTPEGMPKGESNKFTYVGDPGTHMWYDGTPHPWEFKRVWHLEPSLTDPDKVYAGVEDAAFFQTTDGGVTWQELPGLRSCSGPKWQPGAGGMGLHTILLDPANPERIFIAISAAGCFRTEDGGETWKPINRGLRSEFMPDPTAEVGHCVHRIAMHPSSPEHAFYAEALGCDAHRRRRR